MATTIRQSNARMVIIERVDEGGATTRGCAALIPAT